MTLATSITSYWKLDSNSNDSVTTNNGTDTAISYATAGKIGNCATFNGSSSKIDLPNLGVSGSTARTISSWFNTTSISTTQVIYMSGTASSNSAFGIFLNTTANGQIYLYFDGQDYITASGVYTASRFNYLSVVYDGGSLSTTTLHVYINGVKYPLTKVGAVTGSANTTNSNYSLGYQRNTNNNFFSGSIDEVAIWSRALSADEVSQVYNSGRGNAYPLTDTPSLYGGVAYYKLDESSGNASDSIGGNTLTNTNTATYGSGKINNATSLSRASSQYLNGGVVSVLQPTSALSFSMWIKVNTNPASYCAIGGYTLSGQQRGYIFDMATSGTTFAFQVGDGAWGTVSSTYTAGTWHHIVGTWDGSTVRLYKDGSAVGTPVSKASVTYTSSGFSLGRYYGDTTSANMFDGQIDEVGIWNRALSSTEVTALYNSGSGNQYPFSIGAYVMSVLTGAFTLTGNNVNLTKGYVMQVATGVFNLVGNAVNLVLGGITWTNIAKSVTSWTNNSKSSTSWDNQDKTDTTWINQTKS